MACDIINSLSVIWLVSLDDLCYLYLTDPSHQLFRIRTDFRTSTTEAVRKVIFQVILSGTTTGIYDSLLLSKQSTHILCIVPDQSYLR